MQKYKGHYLRKQKKIFIKLENIYDVSYNLRNITRITTSENLRGHNQTYKSSPQRTWVLEITEIRRL